MILLRLQAHLLDELECLLVLTLQAFCYVVRLFDPDKLVVDGGKLAVFAALVVFQVVRRVFLFQNRSRLPPRARSPIVTSLASVIVALVKVVDQGVPAERPGRLQRAPLLVRRAQVVHTRLRPQRRIVLIDELVLLETDGLRFVGHPYSCSSA